MKTRPKKKKLNPIEKRLKDHDGFCRIHNYSLLNERFCTCGRDEAEGIYNEILAFLKKLDTWLEDNDSLASNSFAHSELDVLIEKLNRRK